MIGKLRIKFKIEVIDNACLVARAAHLMTHYEFAEGYSLIRDMQGSDFLTALPFVLALHSGSTALTIPLISQTRGMT
jgi:hypothetical protein